MNNLRRKTLNLRLYFSGMTEICVAMSVEISRSSETGKWVSGSSVDTTPGTSGQTTIHVTNRVDPIGARQIFVQ